MRKKFVFLFFIFCALFFHYSSHAAILVPFFDINLNKNSVGGDGNFNFKIKAYSVGDPTPHIDDQVNLETVNGLGSVFYSNFASNGDRYIITEDPTVGWQNTGVVCASSNPSVKTSSIPGGVVITTRSFSSIDCTFTNKKQSEKVPVLIVPGILGTDLSKGNEKLWLDLGRNFTDVGDQFMDPLQFKVDLTPSEVGLTLGKVISRATGTPEFLINFDYTAGLIQELQSQEYFEGTSATSTLFTFPYDWRYGVTGVFSDGKTNVDALKQKIADIMALTGSDKVDIIAHSTGGLLVKKYVMENPTAHHIDKAVFVGVPNLGAPKAVKVLLQGDNFGIPFLADDEMKKVSQNLPVLYDLAPSNEYYNVYGSFYHYSNWDSDTMNVPDAKDLNFSETYNRLKNNFSANSMAIDNAQALHSPGFDGYDLRTANIDLYNIVGCKSGTVGKVYEYQSRSFLGGNKTSFDAGAEVSGDGTVPLGSSDKLPVSSDHVFYAVKASHGKMPSADGIRQKIVNIISGSSLAVGSNIITKSTLDSDPSKCQLEGHWYQIFSPVAIEITDQAGNRAGIASDGSIQNDIAGADYHVMGEHKFVFLPDDEGQTYTINLKGTGNGTFTLKDQIIVNGQAGQTTAFINIPVTTGGSGQVITGSGGVPVISFDSTGEGKPETILPSAILTNEEAKDALAPISTSTISGVFGQDGFYRSDVSVSLSSVDPIIVGREGETSGVLETKYNLDNQGFKTYDSTTPILVSAEGSHTLVFFSTDKAGNDEPEQTLNLTIDKSAPTVSLSSPTAGEYVRGTLLTLLATSTDDLSGVFSSELKFDDAVFISGAVVDTSSKALGIYPIHFQATDKAGNTASTSATIALIVTPQSVIDDVEKAFVLGWITKKAVKNEIVEKLEKAIKLEKRIEILEERLPEKPKVTKRIEKLEERLDKVLGRAIIKDLEKNHPKFVNDQAYNLLVEEINWLVNN